MNVAFPERCISEPQSLHVIYAASYNPASLYLAKGEMRVAIAPVTSATDKYRAAGRPTAVACLLVLAHNRSGDDDSARTASEGAWSALRGPVPKFSGVPVARLGDPRCAVAMFRGDLDEARALFDVARTHLRRTDKHSATREDLLRYDASRLRDLVRT